MYLSIVLPPLIGLRDITLFYQIIFQDLDMIYQNPRMSGEKPIKKIDPHAGLRLNVKMKT